MKIKENKKRDNNLDFAKKQKMLWNMKVMVIPIIIGTLGTAPKGLVRTLKEQEIGGHAETI